MHKSFEIRSLASDEKSSVKFRFPFLMFMKVCYWFCPLKGDFPHIIMYMITPKLHRSAAGPDTSSFNISGAM
jgi:hypothetical protein